MEIRLEKLAQNNFKAYARVPKMKYLARRGLLKCKTSVILIYSLFKKEGDENNLIWDKYYIG